MQLTNSVSNATEHFIAELASRERDKWRWGFTSGEHLMNLNVVFLMW